jgi:Zn-dependent peptidase ImmA (M78 family)/DNA-binding XRE family transcriptional regulator
MNNNLETFAKRLQQARLKAKLSMEKLSAMMSEKAGVKVSKQAISKYEKAKMMPNSTILIAMAEALGCDLDYFFRPFTFELDQFKVSFRKKSDTLICDQKALEVQIQDEVERYLEIEEILGLKHNNELSSDLIPSKPLVTSSDMVERAQMVRKCWKLGTAPIANTHELLEAHGIKVLLTEAPDNFWGVSGIVNDKTPVIVLNSNDHHIEHRRLTALHELCHLLYNKHFSEELTKHQQEKLCNAFANEMLLPSETLIDLFSGKSKIAFAELEALNINYGISIDAIVYKLKDLGIIGEKRYMGFCKHKNIRPEFKAYIETSRYNEEPTTRFKALVFSALAQQLLSTSKAASLLGVSINKVRNSAVAI